MRATALARGAKAKLRSRRRSSAAAPKKTAVVSLRCSHCGDALTEAQRVHCDDCLFVYCQKHHGADLHLCAVVCAECPAEA